MGVAVFIQVLANFGPERVRRLHQEGTVDSIYVLVWPNYLAPIENHPGNNRAAWWDYRRECQTPMWAWFNASADQAGDAAKIQELDGQLNPAGWLLDIEGAWVKEASLKVLIAGAKATGKPVRASLAGTTSGHVEYDYRTLDLNDVAAEWQSYFDSGEGQSPALSVNELYRSSFVIEGWQYRNRMGKNYGWGRVERFENAQGIYNAHQRAGSADGVFAVGPRAWGRVVVDGKLYRSGTQVGELLGRAKYKNIRVALDTTRGANDKHTAAEWTAIAASARVKGMPVRPAAVYLGEDSSDEVLRAIAAGSA